MNSILKVVSVMVMGGALILALFSIYGCLDQQGKWAIAGEAAAKADLLNAVGAIDFREAEAQEAAANAAGAVDAAAAGGSVVILLLAAIVWLLADGKDRQPAPSPQASGS